MDRIIAAKTKCKVCGQYGCFGHETGQQEEGEEILRLTKAFLEICHMASPLTVAKAVVRCLHEVHPTNQQLVMERGVKSLIGAFADLKFVDGRNEASRDLAKKLLAECEEAYLPYI